MRKFRLAFILLLVSQVVIGQYQIGVVPRVSPDRAVYQKVGYTEVEVKYGSPAVKDRQVWGGLVSYESVWRAGANNATTVEFNTEVTINNAPVDSGKYALFIIPKENDKWTIIFNRTHKQWGAFRYAEEEDVLRVDVRPREKEELFEHLTYSIAQEDYNNGSIVLNWEYLEIEIPFETNYHERFKKEIEARADAQPEYLQWVVYVQGAEHLEAKKSNLDLAFTWINRAERIMDASVHSEWDKQFYPRDYIKAHLYWTKAKLFAQKGNYKEAIEYAERTKSVENPVFYSREKGEEGVDQLIEKWKEGRLE